MLGMPGHSHRGPLPPLTERQESLRDALRRDVEYLAGAIGERNVWTYPKLAGAADFIEASFRQAGCEPARQTYDAAGQSCHNLEVEIGGGRGPGPIFVVGAHYDSVPGSPGANDNGSGVAAVLALAALLVAQETAATLRLVAFVNEEPPFFQTDQMGSLVYARRCKERQENVAGMLSLETIGYYSDAEGSQHYPIPVGWMYPSRGDFIGFVANVSSWRLVRRVIGSFRRHAKFPSEGAVVPARIPGVGWSDHWSFWKQGYPALMVTDTAPFRYPYYHTSDDTPEKIDYDRLARVVDALAHVLVELAGGNFREM